MEEGRTNASAQGRESAEADPRPRERRGHPLLVALAGVILLAAVWATMALAGGSSPAAKPAKAPAAKAQVSKAQSSDYARSSGDHDCPFEDEAASNDL
jgi:hypothetical protein